MQMDTGDRQLVAGDIVKVGSGRVSKFSFEKEQDELPRKAAQHLRSPLHHTQPLPNNDDPIVKLRSLQDEVDENDVEAADESARPLHFFDGLRNATNFSTRPGSAVYRVDTGNETIRLVHILSIHPYSEVLANGVRIPVDELAYVEASAFLAMHHFNQRNPVVLPKLHELLGDCNVYMTIDIVDTILSPIVASRKALEYFVRPSGDLSLPLPVSIAGATRSAVTQPLSVLAGVYHTPIINSQSTSSTLDIKASSPTFTRTIPTNRVDSIAAVAYLKSLGVTHFGVLFVRDNYGSEFARDLNSAAAAENITVLAAAYNDNDEGSIVGALEKLGTSKYRYFFAVLTASPARHAFVIREASKLGMMGNPEYAWFFGEASTLLLEGAFFRTKLNGTTEADREIASALSGSGLILINIPQHEPFNTALRDLGRNKELYDYYVSRHDAPEMFNGTEWDPIPSFYDQVSYDAMISLGLGLCNITNEFPTGEDIVDAIKATEFVGTSGLVHFDSITGTRATESVTFRVINLLVDSDGDSINFTATTTSIVSLATKQVETLSPFVYAQGSEAPPLPLPTRDIEYNLLGRGVRALGWSLAGAVILLAAWFLYWTYDHRKSNMVRAIQPQFLGLLCIGAILMSSTIVPMSFQEPLSQETLDRACISIPWLFVMGFATAFSSLYCKLYRLNKVFRQSAGMQRVEVKAKDAMLPFVVIVVTNFAVLLAWTIVAPLQWSRTFVANYDQFGRSVESYGSCFKPASTGRFLHWSTSNVFFVALGVFNLVVVLFANYQCYLSRKVPSDFNESYSIALSMLSILEGFLLGIPILFLTFGKPSASFVVASVLIAFLCMAIILPTFGSKMFIKRLSARLNRSDWHATWRRYNTRDSSESKSLWKRRSAPESSRRISSETFPRDSVAAIRERVAQQKSHLAQSDSFRDLPLHRVDAKESPLA